MPHYFLHLRTPDNRPHRTERHDLPSLHDALAIANASACMLLRKQAQHGQVACSGSLEIEDEGRRTVARILLGDVARQIV